MDLTAIGAIFAAVITALGIRDLLKLYVTRHEGCGKANCKKAMDNYLVIKKKMTYSKVLSTKSPHS